jgi:Na+-transporting NADH:ubiquinone oxidoreductase subunit F
MSAVRKAMIWFRRFHKWIALLIGIQIALWMLSGFMMGLLDHDQVLGHHNQRIPAERPLFSESRAVTEPHLFINRLPDGAIVRGIKLIPFLDRQAFRVDTPERPYLFDAIDGTRIQVSDSITRELALRDYSGSGRIVSVMPVEAPSMEVRRHKGSVWRVDFDDSDETSLYVSGSDGAILERRNSTWRLFDVFWMLHIMDYQNREDFNNLLVIFISLLAAFFSMTGIILYVDSFRKDDFLGLIPGDWWRKKAKLVVCAPHGEVVARVNALSGGRLYDELAKGDILLPSNCGGGGTCGLCVVSLDPSVPISAADRRLIPDARIQDGIRLSCQAQATDNLVVGISDEVLSAETMQAEVVSARYVTPFIREITLKLDNDDFDFPAGSYIHVIIPPHQISLEEIDTPARANGNGRDFEFPKSSTSSVEVRRAYSLAIAPRDNKGHAILNVRFMPPPGDAPDVPAGIGSSFMWSLKAGDHLDIVGPLGDFRAFDTERDMIVLGGGAGMAPLRSIIRDELLHKSSGRRIDFWYGGRCRQDLFYVEEFDDLQEQFTNFSWQPVLSEVETGDDWDGPTGYVHLAAREGLLNHLDTPAECEYYVCGPPPMLSATRQMLADLGVPEDQVFFDDFGI